MKEHVTAQDDAILLSEPWWFGKCTLGQIPSMAGRLLRKTSGMLLSLLWTELCYQFFPKLQNGRVLLGLASIAFVNQSKEERMRLSHTKLNYSSGAIRMELRLGRPSFQAWRRRGGTRVPIPAISASFLQER